MLRKRKDRVITDEEQEEIRTKDFFDLITPSALRFFTATATAAYGRFGNIRRPPRRRRFSRSLRIETA